MYTYRTNCLSLLTDLRSLSLFMRRMCMVRIYLANCIYNSSMFCLFVWQLSVHFLPCCLLNKKNDDEDEEQQRS